MIDFLRHLAPTPSLGFGNFSFQSDNPHPTALLKHLRFLGVHISLRYGIRTSWQGYTTWGRHMHSHWGRSHYKTTVFAFVLICCVIRWTYAGTRSANREMPIRRVSWSLTCALFVISLSLRYALFAIPGPCRVLRLCPGLVRVFRVYGNSRIGCWKLCVLYHSIL